MYDNFLLFARNIEALLGQALGCDPIGAFGGVENCENKGN
jgi:hypothetical protein